MIICNITQYGGVGKHVAHVTKSQMGDNPNFDNIHGFCLDKYFSHDVIHKEEYKECHQGWGQGRSTQRWSYQGQEGETGGRW